MKTSSILWKPFGTNSASNSFNQQRNSSFDLDKVIKGALKSQRQAQQELYKKYYNQILGICLRYTNDRQEAKSLVNEIFLKVFKSLQQYNGKGTFEAWLNRIAINKSIDHVRKKNNYTQVIRSTAELPDKAIGDSVLDQMATEEIIACIQKVSPTSRTVFSLYVIDGYKHNEIAEMLKISVGTSRWHLSNAKKELQILLKNYVI